MSVTVQVVARPRQGPAVAGSHGVWRASRDSASRCGGAACVCADVGAQGEEAVGARGGAPTAGDLLMDLDHADVAFDEAVVERDPEVVRETQDLLAVAV